MGNQHVWLEIERTWVSVNAQEGYTFNTTVVVVVDKMFIRTKYWEDSLRGQMNTKANAQEGQRFKITDIHSHTRHTRVNL